MRCVDVTVPEYFPKEKVIFFHGLVQCEERVLENTAADTK